MAEQQSLDQSRTDMAMARGHPRVLKNFNTWLIGGVYVNRNKSIMRDNPSGRLPMLLPQEVENAENEKLERLRNTMANRQRELQEQRQSHQPHRYVAKYSTTLPAATRSRTPTKNSTSGGEGMDLTGTVPHVPTPPPPVVAAAEGATPDSAASKGDSPQPPSQDSPSKPGESLPPADQSSPTKARSPKRSASPPTSPGAQAAPDPTVKMVENREKMKHSLIQESNTSLYRTLFPPLFTPYNRTPNVIMNWSVARIAGHEAHQAQIQREEEHKKALAEAQRQVHVNLNELSCVRQGNSGRPRVRLRGRPAFMPTGSVVTAYRTFTNYRMALDVLHSVGQEAASVKVKARQLVHTIAKPQPGLMAENKPATADGATPLSSSSVPRRPSLVNMTAGLGETDLSPTAANRVSTPQTQTQQRILQRAGDVFANQTGPSAQRTSPGSPTGVGARTNSSGKMKRATSSASEEGKGMIKIDAVQARPALKKEGSPTAGAAVAQKPSVTIRTDPEPPVSSEAPAPQAPVDADPASHADDVQVEEEPEEKAPQ